MDGQMHDVGKWDLVIAHPPCTYLTITGNRWFDVNKYGEAAKKREKDRYKAIVFFMRCVYANARCVAVENPIGIMGTAYRKAAQIIQPYQYGHKARKATCLWLKNLPPLEPTETVEPAIVYYKTAKGKISSFSANYGSGTKGHSERRSKTYVGIAAAMAKQWGDYLLSLPEE